MTAPTRRQLIAGSLAAVGAAGAPAIAIAADPQERLRNAVQELRDAMLARWPDAKLNELAYIDGEPDKIPCVLIAAHLPS